MSFRKKIAAFTVAAGMIISSFAGCGGTDNNAVLININNGEATISYGYANMVAKYEQAMYDQIYVAYFGSSVWNQDVGEGVTFQENVKDDILETLKEEYVTGVHAADYGVEITAEDEAAIAEVVSEFMSTNTKKAIKQMGATEEYLTEYLKSRTIQARVQEAVEAEATITEVPEETEDTEAEAAAETEDAEAGTDTQTEEAAADSDTAEETVPDEATQRTNYYKDVVAGWEAEYTFDLDEELWAKITFDKLFELTEEDAAGNAPADTDSDAADTEATTDSDAAADTEAEPAE